MSTWEWEEDDAQADGDGAGMHPNFDLPEPAEFTADLGDDDACSCPECKAGTDPLDSYALGWTHGWEDHEAMYNEDDGPPLAPAYGFFNGFVLATLIWAALALGIMACPAQSPAVTAGAGAFNYGYVSDSARVFLEQGWDTSNPMQVERGYCIEPSDVAVDTTPDHANIAWRIHHVTLPVRVSLATPYAISFHCSETAIASVHTHTPTTCAHDPKDPYGLHPSTCALGGDDAYLCSVDEADRTSARHDAFMVVQCGRGQFVWYWPGRRG